MPSAAPPIMAARSLMSRNGPRGFYVGPARAVEGATRPPRAQARRLQWWPTEDGDRGPWLGRGSWHEWTPARKRGSSTSNARGLRAGRWIGVGGRHGLVLGLALLLALGETRDRRDALPFLEVDQAHTLRVAANHADLVDPQADHLPTARDQHDLIVIRHHANADHAPGLVGGLHGDDALAAAPRETVLVHLGPLAVAVLRDGEERGAGLHQIQGDHLVPLVELHAPHAIGVA